MKIPFNKTYTTAKEIIYISEALSSKNISGNYRFNKRVKDLMFQKYGLEGIVLTPSCTAALEMGVMLSDLKPGDEVIMPSFTFSSTANAVLIFGATPVFCEVEEGEMNIDVSEIEKLITDKTKMIIPIDYGGVPCDIDPIMELAEKYNLIVMQDCAQSYGALYKNEVSGKKAHLACYSFHDTKNITCGEGGALVVNKHEWRERASLLMEKGTDRNKMLKGLIDKYSWIEIGSSYLLSDILAAMLLAQLEKEEDIKSKRKKIYENYSFCLKELKDGGYLKLQKIKKLKKTNYHSFWLLLNSNQERDLFITKMEEKGIAAYTSFVPLHSSKMGVKLGNRISDLAITEDLSSRIIRLPIYPDLLENEVEYVCKMVKEIVLNNFNPKKII